MEKFIDIKELSDKLGVEVSTIYKWTHKRKIPFVHVGKLVRFSESDVMSWLRQRTVTPVTPIIPVRRRQRVRRPHKSPGATSYVDNLVELAKKEVLG